MQVKVYQDVLDANDRLAQINRKRFAELRLAAVNLIGSPGCGKTTLLERTLKMLMERGRARPAVIEGDLETSRDAERIARCGAPAVQINTNGGCHLDAAMIQAVLDDLPLDKTDVLFIENVGNLVCPADYDLGETCKATVLSVTEGDDKPAKYPIIFRRSAAVAITKLDLLPHTDFRMDEALRHMRLANQAIRTFPLSARTMEGMNEWVEWIEELARQAKSG